MVGKFHRHDEIPAIALEYVEIARARVAHAVKNAPIAAQEPQQVASPAKIIKLPRRKKNAVSELQLSLFA